MKILSLHCDYMKFRPLKKAIKKIKDLVEKDKKETHVKDALAILTAVEKVDKNIPGIVSKLVDEVKNIADQLSANKIVLYPYAHLSENLSDPDTAMNVLDEAEKALKKAKFEVYRAPFGYYKEFEMKVKGHPLSELSRNIIFEGDESALDAKMETSCHLVYETARKMLSQDFVSISKVEGNKAVLNWKNFKNKIDDSFIKKLEKEANKNLESNLPVNVGDLSREKALELCGKFYDNVVPKKFDEVRVVTIKGLPPEPCIHPHVSNTNEIGGGISIEGFEKVGKDSYKIKISLQEQAEDYDPKQLLKEISKNVLDKSKLKENDHRIIGQQMDLYSFNETAPGMVFWHNNGLIIRNALIEFWREIHRKAGYEEIKTPQIMDDRLWKISGHWEKYKENIFLTNYEKRSFAVKPMNCPGGMLVYKNSPKSYKELPLKIGELGEVHRQELSGVLGGLFRVIQFTQDDAHIYCTEKQIEQEVFDIMDLIDFVYKKLGFDYRVELSTRPEKRIGSDKIWDKSEAALQKALEKKKVNFKINEGDGAFYGPKIDFHLTDSLGRNHQCGTIQLDMSMPKRFELEYTDKDNKKKRPIMLHRTVFGSLERFMGILIEHFNGWLPTWLAPIQVRVINFTERNEDYAKGVIQKLGEAIPNLRVDADFTSSTVQSKVKESSLMRIPYVIVVGDREEKSGELAVREKGNNKISNYSVEDFVKKVKKEFDERV